MLRSSRNQHGLRVSKNRNRSGTSGGDLWPEACWWARKNEFVISYNNFISASSWTPRFQSSLSPSWSMLPSPVTASAKLIWFIGLTYSDISFVTCDTCDDTMSWLYLSVKFCNGPDDVIRTFYLLWTPLRCQNKLIQKMRLFICELMKIHLRVYV